MVVVGKGLELSTGEAPLLATTAASLLTELGSLLEAVVMSMLAVKDGINDDERERNPWKSVLLTEQKTLLVLLRSSGEWLRKAE